MVYMLVTSGLRASELCQIKWGDLDFASGKWTARFIGKGAKDAEQELFPTAVEAWRQYFGEHFRRAPRPKDALFWTISTFQHQEPEPMTPHTLWTRVKNIGGAAVAAGVITRELQFSPQPISSKLCYVALQERDEAQGDPEPDAARQHRNALQALRGRQRTRLAVPRRCVGVR